MWIRSPEWHTKRYEPYTSTHIFFSPSKFFSHPYFTTFAFMKNFSHASFVLVSSGTRIPPGKGIIIVAWRMKKKELSHWRRSFIYRFVNWKKSINKLVFGGLCLIGLVYVSSIKVQRSRSTGSGCKCSECKYARTYSSDRIHSLRSTVLPIDYDSHLEWRASLPHVINIWDQLHAKITSAASQVTRRRPVQFNV